MNVQKILQLYLDQVATKTTRQQYGQTLAPLCQFLGTETAITAVAYANLLDYITQRRSEPTRHGRSRAESTIKSEIQVIKAFFNWCVETGLIEHSPAEKMRFRKVVADTAASRAVPEDELQRMVDYWRWDARNFALMLFLADTGCRAGGCASLRISRLDLEQRTAVLVEKGNREHRVMFGSRTAEALQSWLATRPAVKHDFVWSGQGPDYEPISPNGIAYVVRTAARNTGASRDWGPHAIRHYVGHKLAKAGVPVTIIQRKLGHASPETTLRHYMPLDDGYLRKITDEHGFQPTPPPVESTSGNIIHVSAWRQAN